MRTTRLCASLVLFRLSEEAEASNSFCVLSRSSIARSRCTMSLQYVVHLTFSSIDLSLTLIEVTCAGVTELPSVKDARHC